MLFMEIVHAKGFPLLEILLVLSPSGRGALSASKTRDWLKKNKKKKTQDTMEYAFILTELLSVKNL